ncbi:MAG: T9SS type A sorting domain-containing protein [Bacteroidetes bacterium]|nr:T9SS type A sorting domain-containing protein [Bacteroidota bacterium]
MKKLLLISTAVLGLTVANGQTNVSGGIFSNTTWTKVNSPYIVTSTVVVFPGIILTIQPGVTVKFANNQQLEIRQAKLIAIGTATDSITFTSNAVSPTAGIYTGIYLNGDTLIPAFNYCNIKYASSGINNNTQSPVTIKNSNFIFNQTGLNSDTLSIDTCNFRNNSNAIVGNGPVNNCIISNNQIGMYASSGIPFSKITNCIVDSNQTGLKFISGPVVNCIIKYNQVGIECIHYTNANNCIIKNNTRGMVMNALMDTIRNSIIDSNVVTGVEIYGGWDCVENNYIGHNGIGIIDSSYDIANSATTTKNYIENNNIGIRLGSDGDKIFCNRICNNTLYDLTYTTTNNTTAVHNNYWCTPDSASTEAVIYDGYDDVNYGLVFFMPNDSVCAPSNPTSINEITQTYSLRIFPNPFSTQTTLRTDNLLHNATLTVDNCFGQTVAQIKNINGRTVTFSRDNLASGLYFVRLTEENNIFVLWDSEVLRTPPLLQPGKRYPTMQKKRTRV